MPERNLIRRHEIFKEKLQNMQKTKKDCFVDYRSEKHTLMLRILYIPSEYIDIVNSTLKGKSFVSFIVACKTGSTIKRVKNICERSILSNFFTYVRLCV